MTVADLVVAAFTFSNSLRTFAYVPQIVSLARDREGARGVSRLTWALFLLSHASGLAYALVVVADTQLALMFGANALCCLAIIGLATARRRAPRGEMLRGAATGCTAE